MTILSENGYNEKIFIRTSGFPIEQAVLGEGEVIHSDGTVITVIEINSNGHACSWWADIEINDSEQEDIVYHYNESKILMLLDDYSGITHAMQEISDEEGIMISFKPAIPVCTHPPKEDEESHNKWIDGNGWDLSETHRLIFNISDQPWVLTNLRKFQNQTLFVLGKEESHAILMEGGLGTLYVGGKELRLFDRHQRHLEIGLEGKKSTRRNISAENLEEYQNRYLKTWWYGTGYAGEAFAEISSLSHLLVFSDPENNITIRWENETSWDPALESVFIPRSSPTYEDLTSKTSD